MKKFYIDELISCLFLLLTVLVVVLNITLRYFFNSPLRGGEELATIFFIWSVFVGAAVAYRKKMHMGIDLLIQLLPSKYEIYIKAIVNIILIILNSTFMFLSIKFTIISRIRPTAVLGISSLYVNSSLVLCFVLMFIYSLMDAKNLVKEFKEIKVGEING